MTRPTLTGRSILIVEDEPLIAMDLAATLKAAGAQVATVNTADKAFHFLDDQPPSAAIVDHALGDGDSTRLCLLLTERSIPFIVHSGRDALPPECDSGVQLRKPVQPDLLVATVAGLFSAAT